MAAQIHDLARKFDALQLVIPLAKKLDGILDCVTQMQASAFEYTEQVRALHLAVQRVEQAQRDSASAHTMLPDPIGPSRPSGSPLLFLHGGRFSLEVPWAVWADVAMDFIEGLPPVHGKTVILTVVDRFSKCAHFIPLVDPYTATTVAVAFFAEIVRLHGVPTSIVSDRDPGFTYT
ncbi:hypothetical protein E2562_008280 [Oryza meyeriana var. granulata]|uniref:Integrase catalytic domain-containing protein n=1 Tax=Oryza meyeriana var. granulata TaxID=110450 RepID=A0A6G1DFY0_9ORYZ|nr:hypothetical protein E2562_008280 [Oryza meyeriana var. granulata]